MLMDFHSILSIAQQKQQDAERKKSSHFGLTTKFSAPKKESKPKEKKSEAIQKLLEEKKQEQIQKEKRKREKEKELEKANRFRIPKADKSKQDEKKNERKEAEKIAEEVVIHKEDFVKSSSKKRKAHNPGFVQRPSVPPVKDEKPETSIRPTPTKSLSSSDIPQKHSSEKSIEKQKLHSQSHSSLSGKSSSTKHTSKQVPSKQVPSKPDPSHRNNGNNKVQVKSKESVDKPKPKPRPMPPPMNFESLLKLAEVKSKEVPQVDIPQKKVVREPEGSLMTQQEKDRIARTTSKSYQEWLKFGASKTTPESLKTPSDLTRNGKTCQALKSATVKRKLCPDTKSEEIKNKAAKYPPKGTEKTKPFSKVNLKEKMRSKSCGVSVDSSGQSSKSQQRHSLESSGRPKHSGDLSGRPIKTSHPLNPLNRPSKTLQRRPEEIPKSLSKESSGKQFKHPNGHSSNPRDNIKGATGMQSASHSKTLLKSQQNKPQSALQRTKSESGLDRRKGLPGKPPARKPTNNYSATNENVLVCGPSRQEPAPKPQNPWDRIYGQIQKDRPVQVKRRIEDDYDEEEEDWSDEDDDFIDDDFVDDGPIRGDNYSSHLKEMFGYSYRDRFRNFDDRDTNMESSFSQQMKEEARSTRLGKMEDLEDMKKEEEELRMKKLAKKKKMKGK